jgi:hypothetical protein
MANNIDRYGYAEVRHLPSTASAVDNIQLVMTAIRERAAIYSRTTAAMLETLAVRTTNHQENFALPGAGTLQPMDANGIPLLVRPSGSTTVAYPMYWGATAAGRNRESAALETIEDVYRDQEDAENRDATWLRRWIIASLLTKNTRTFVDDKWGSLTVQPSAITSDGVTYTRNSGASSTAQHYIAQAAAIADATNPFPTIYSTLKAYPSNAGRDIVVFVPTANVAAVEALLTFYPVADPDIRMGSAADVLVPTGRNLLAMGDAVLGKVGTPGVWVVEWSALPENYLLAVVDGRPPLAMRESPAEKLRGFFPEFELKHGAFPERRFIRYCGFGVRNRISSLAFFVGAGDTVYDNPADFTAPITN